MQKGMTITQFLIEKQREFDTATGDFTALLNGVVLACKQIAGAVNKAGLIGVLGAETSENVQGEVQKKLDVISNDMMINALKWGGFLAGMASEEEETCYQIPSEYKKGKYLILFDPLDGSSNLDANISTGTIFSILKAPAGKTDIVDNDFLQPGTEQVCAGYCLYGPATVMVLTTGQGVNAFTLDKDVGEFYLTEENIQIPVDTREFAINASNARFWEPPIKRYIDECLAGTEGPRGENFNMRWVASMVAEIHRILSRGGIFMYPKDTKDPTKAGRLRLMYEANPMSMIIEQAGGASSTARGRIMEVAPEGLHQRVPVIMGSKNEVELVVSYHNE